MITLTLLHPLQSVPVQNWSFQPKPVIKIGRSTDNDVVLYSAVVSRHHVELRHNGSCWNVVNVGSNGTYINGQKIDEEKAKNGMVIRLASSGPKIQIQIEGDEAESDDTRASKLREKKTRSSLANKDTLVS